MPSRYAGGMIVAVNAPVDALLEWTRSHPAYAYTVDATELAGTAVRHSTLEIAYDGRVPLETVRVIDGSGKGTVVTWRAGERAGVRPPGVLHALAIPMSVRDPRILSPRGNDVRAAIFARVADCIAAHAGEARIERGPATTAIEIRDPDGIRCGAEDGDARVTVDRVTLDRDERPIARERYVGTTLVERWVMRDLRVLP
jgi:hypothetical protein